MENATNPKNFTELAAHIAAGGIVKVADKLIKSVDKLSGKSAVVWYYGDYSDIVPFKRIKMLPAPLPPGEFLVSKSYGQVYEIVSANAKNKTYLCKLVFTPENYPFEKYPTGSKAHVSFWMVGKRYEPISSLKS